MLNKIEIMITIMISSNVLQRRLISQKYKKCSPGKYALLLYVAVSIRWISIRFDFVFNNIRLHVAKVIFVENPRKKFKKT